MAAPPFKVKAIFEYSSGHDDDLNFTVGQIITVTEEEGDDWYVGEYVDASGAKQDGLFPKNFVEKYEPEVPTRPTRAVRQKTEPRPPPEAEPERDMAGPEDDAPPVPAFSKPAPTQEEQVMPPVTKNEPPPASKPAPGEPVQSEAPPAKAKPPPVAPKNNAFKDRIAAFNKGEQAPIAPMSVGRQAPRNEYIKRPFVAEPPSRHAYVPPVTKAEPVHRPYIREEDPEIRKMQEEDRQAAESAGLTGDSQTEEADNVPKPLSLKERMAMLQKEQEAQRTRHAEASHKKEKKPPVKKPSVPSEPVVAPELDEAEQSRARSGERNRQSLDAPAEHPRVPSVQRRPTDQMSPVPAVPEHEILSGGEEADQSAAGETEEDDAGTIGPEDSDEKPAVGEVGVGEEDDSTEDAGEEEEEEEELDEEELRKQRIRERMARLAGGQAGGQPFNPFGMPPTAAPVKKRSTKERRTNEEDLPSSPPQVPQMVAIPGMGSAMPPHRVQSPESDTTQKVETIRGGSEYCAAESEEQPMPPPRRSTTEERAAPPPAPKDRPVPPAPAERGLPPPVPTDGRPRHTAPESRPVPPPPPSAAPLSRSPGSESDDEISMGTKRLSTETPGVEQALPIRMGAPPVPTPGKDLPPRLPQSPDSKRSSYFGSAELSSATSEKRMSRPPPPIPGLSSPTSPRPPPPPPPSWQNTTVQPSEDDERGESDYEGDYDTDIASSAKHKDALKAHAREPSLDDSTTADEMTPVTTPQHQLPRAVPPPLPSQAPSKAGRPSMDAPRAAPPPIPPPQSRPLNVDDVDYDPYRYDPGRAAASAQGAMPQAAPPVPPIEGQESDADEDESPPPLARKSTERAPPPPPHGAVPPMPPPGVLQHQPPPTRALPKQSLEIQRQQNMGRRSQEGGNRQSGEFAGQMAQDIDLSHGSQWWTAENALPPALQSRNGVDILSESEESQTSKRGGRMTISKDIYVLYMDYSQTIITAQYDSQYPVDVNLEQRHEPPPPRLRQDQLESYWQRFGRPISEAANAAGNSKKDNVFGDGSPPALPLELIKRQSDALLPVGTRAYGALVYANLANASTMQFDEIRPGDIITVRNAKFEGHHGAMKSKYKSDYGPSHVGVVEEWDGTRRTIRAWEQGREKKGGVRSEKFRLGDLRSGEVRVWRVVGRKWVGWDN